MYSAIFLLGRKPSFNFSVRAGKNLFQLFFAPPVICLSLFVFCGTDPAAVCLSTFASLFIIMPVPRLLTAYLRSCVLPDAYSLEPDPTEQQIRLRVHRIPIRSDSSDHAPNHNHMPRSLLLHCDIRYNRQNCRPDFQILLCRK